jgi:deoxyribonuclease-4
MGAECMQVFLSAPQRWLAPKHTDEQVDLFCTAIGECGIRPNFVHATYLVNLASNDPLIRDRSVENLCATLSWADRIGLAGAVIHVGSGRGQPIDEAVELVARGLEQVLMRNPRCAVLLENSAGSGDTLGARFAQIGSLVDRLGRDPRLGLCLDTAHAFASGYDLRVEDGLEQALAEIDAALGLERLQLLHANDSKVGLGSAVDRHANIGRGLLGGDAFVRMLSHASLRDLPWVLEVPGYEDKGPDKPNLDELKRLAGRSASLNC